MKDNDFNFAPFYIGQKVVGSDYCPVGSRIKKGLPYIISTCHYSYCHNGNNYYWYVGVEGNNNNWMTPKLFIPVEEKFQSISLEKVLENETPLISVN